MISIAIPAYKPQFLNKAIQSVLTQTYTDIEIIIINDGSPHEIDSIINEKNDKRIQYYKNMENLGQENLINCWNKCLEYAKGEYFSLFSDDDYYQEDFLSELYKLSIQYPNTDVFHCRVRKINELGETLGYTPVCPEFENVLDMIWHTLHGYRNQYISDMLFKTDKLKQIGGFYNLPLAWGSDYITSFIMASFGGIVYSPRVLCNWRTSEFNISSNGDINKRLDAIDKYQKWMDQFLHEYISNTTTEEDIKNQCIHSSRRFFDIKREFLINQQLKKESFLQSISRIFYYSKKFRIPFKKILYFIGLKKINNL